VQQHERLACRVAAFDVVKPWAGFQPDGRMAKVVLFAHARNGIVIPSDGKRTFNRQSLRASTVVNVES
jgi:hypothetical protein